MLKINSLSKYLLALSIALAPSYALASDTEDNDVEGVESICICQNDKDDKEKGFEAEESKAEESKNEESKAEAEDVDNENYCVCANGATGVWSKPATANKSVAPSSTQVIRGK